MTNLPATKLLIRNSYIGLSQPGYTEAYLMAVHSKPNSALLFTLYTQHGAIFGGLPLEALAWKPIEGLPYNNQSLQPYSTLEGEVSYIAYPLLKDAVAMTRLGNYGTYLFTLVYNGGGLADDPEQNKTHNVIMLDNGQISALPNNYLLFRDNWFAGTPTTWPSYSRVSRRYTAGG